MVGLVIVLRVFWKFFSVDFDGIKDCIFKNVEVVEFEVGLVEKELVSKECILVGECWVKVE